MKIGYYVSKLIDDPRGLDMSIEGIYDWVNQMKNEGCFKSMPEGYIDDINETLNLIMSYKNDLTLKHHLAVLLHYYICTMCETYHIDLPR